MELAKRLGISEAELEEVRKGLYQNTDVAVRYINDLKNKVTDRDHTLYGGLTKEASIGIPAPWNTGGRLKEVHELFTKQELAILSHDLGNPEIENLKSAFWKDGIFDEYKNPLSFFPINLKKEGLSLNLLNPEDVIRYRILANSSIVAKDEESKYDLASYRFYIVNSEDALNGRILDMNIKQKASVIFGKIYERSKVLSYVLRTLGKSVASDANIKFLQSECYELVEDRAREFVAVASDELLVHKISIEEFVKAGLIIVKNGFYYTSEGKELSLDGKLNDLNGAAQFLNSPIGNATFVGLKGAYKKLAEESKAK